MPRKEWELMTDWYFAMSETKPARETFRPVTLPHDWAVSMPFDRDMKEGEPQGFWNRWGIGWYRRSICLEEVSKEHCYYVEFGGIFEKSTVWVNGVEAGGRSYGYSTFRIDATPYVSPGENEILVKVDNTQSPADRWYSGCGIYRTVKWIETEKKHLNEWEVIVNTYLSEEEAKVTIQTGAVWPVKAVLTERGCADIVGEGSSDQSGKIEIKVRNPKLWSAREPYLYELVLCLIDDHKECDRIHLSVGIREVKFVKGQGMLVNGKRETLKGVCVHQDVGAVGIAAKKEIWRQRLLALKEMGCNAIRTAHHVFSEEFMELCDELGFYVYDECFDKWVFGSYERYFEKEWQQDVDAMVKRDRNHPCVVIWGVGNEETNQGQQSMLGILERLCNYVRSLDSTRPVTYAMKPHFMRDGNPSSDLVVHEYADRIPFVKKIGDIVDILCCNYMDQWYPAIHEVLPDRLILGTEVYPYFAGHSKQMQNFEENIPSLVPEKLEYCIGSMIWTGIDYLGESAGYPFKGRSNGALRTNGERRFLYYILQSYWTHEPMVRFAVMDYTLTDEGTKWHWSTPPFVEHWHFPQFYKVMIPYVIASNCEMVKLYLNGVEYLVSKPEDCRNRLITGFLPYLPGCIRVVGIRGGQEVCCHEVKTPGEAVRLKFDRERWELPAQKGYEVLLKVRAVDQTDYPVFRESSRVRFRVEGAAQIIAVDSGDLMSHESYQEDMVHLYQGQAAVMLRLEGKTGKVTIWADGEGLLSGQAMILVKER